MKLHPSVLREVSEDLELVRSDQLSDKERHATDSFRLIRSQNRRWSDGSVPLITSVCRKPGESVVLVGGPDVPTHVTGIAVAVIGS